MALDDITNLFEIIAAIATVATLIYLAIQIRSNNKLQRAESRRNVMAQSGNLAVALTQSKEATSVFFRGLNDYEQLTPEEAMQLDFMLSLLAGQSELAFTDWRLGISDVQTFEHPSSHFFQMLKSPAGRAYWSRNGHGHTAEFQAYVNKEVYGAEASR